MRPTSAPSVLPLAIGLLAFSAVPAFAAFAYAASASAAGSARLSAPKAPWRFHGFPIAAWWGPPGTATDRDFAAYRDAGFTLHATNLDQGFDAALASLERIGLPSITLRQPGNFELPPRADLVPPTDRDIIVGWIVDDEPNGDDVASSIADMNALMRQDPTRWTFFNMLPPNLQEPPGTAVVVAQATAAGMPIVSYDDYAIFADGTDRPDQFYGNLATVSGASLAGGAPFWAFAVTIQHTGYAGTYRRPSESDLRWMQFSNLAYGAKGLWYFTYWGATTLPGFAHVGIVGNDGTPSELYPMVRAINQTVLAVGDVLLGLTSAGVGHTRGALGPGQDAFVAGTRWIDTIRATDALVGWFVDAAGVDYALVVNKLHGPGASAAATEDAMHLTFAKDVTAVEAVSWLDGSPGPLGLAADGAEVTLRVAGGTGVLLRASRR
jgi:hypothetical protein